VRPNNINTPAILNALILNERRRLSSARPPASLH